MRSTHAPFARSAIALALVAGIVLLGTTARGAPSPAEVETARASFKQGDAAFDEGDFGAALRAYRMADEVMAVPATRFAVCEALDELGRLVEARSACLEASRLSLTKREPARTAKTRSDAKDRAEQIAERIPTVELALRGAPVDSELTLEVDGEPLRGVRMDTPIRIDPGTHALTVTVAGYRPYVHSVTLREGETRLVEVPLESRATDDEPKVPKATTSTLVVRSPLPGQVYVDGTEQGSPPLEVEVSLGGHHVKIEFDPPIGGEEEQRVVVTKGRPNAVEFDPSGRIAASRREGVTFGLTLGAAIHAFGESVARVPERTGEFTSAADEFGGGAQAGVVMDVGLGSHATFRSGILIAGGALAGSVGGARCNASYSTGFNGEISLLSNGCTGYDRAEVSGWFSAMVPLSLQFHVGSVYAPLIGLRAGISTWGARHQVTRGESLDLVPIVSDTDEVGVPTVAFALEPTISLLRFRFGEQRNFELGLDQSVHLVVGGARFAAAAEARLVEDTMSFRGVRSQLTFVCLFNGSEESQTDDEATNW